MILFLIISVFEKDISFIKFLNFTETKHDKSSWISPNYDIVESIQDFISIIPKISKTKWIFISSGSTAVAPRYVSYILNSIPTEKSRNQLVGRFGCIPTIYVPENINEFKLCYRFPILESGFAFTSDLLQKKQFQRLIEEFNSSKNISELNKNYDFNSLTDSSSIIDSTTTLDIDSTIKHKLSSLKLEYFIGLGTHEADAIDDFRFSFFASNSTFRHSLFLASFNPISSSNLDPNFLHASGIRFKEKVSPYAEGEIILGTGLNFNGEIYPFDDRVTISCLPYNASLVYSPYLNKAVNNQVKSSDGSLICYPPYHYSDHFNVQITCF